MKTTICFVGLLCVAIPTQAQVVEIGPIAEYGFGAFHPDLKTEEGHWVGIDQRCSEVGELSPRSNADVIHECEYKAWVLEYTDSGDFSLREHPAKDQGTLEAMYLAQVDEVYALAPGDKAVTYLGWEQAVEQHKIAVSHRDEHVTGQPVDEFEVASGQLGSLTWKVVFYWVAWTTDGRYSGPGMKVVFNNTYEYTVIIPEWFASKIDHIWLEGEGTKAKIVLTYVVYCGNRPGSCPTRIAVFDYPSLFEPPN